MAEKSNDVSASSDTQQVTNVVVVPIVAEPASSSSIASSAAVSLQSDAALSFQLFSLRNQVREKMMKWLSDESDMVKMLRDVGLTMSSIIKPYSIRWLEREMQVMATPHLSGGWHLTRDGDWGISLYNNPIGKRHDGVMGIRKEVHPEFDSQCCGDDSFEVKLASQPYIRGYQTFSEVQEMIRELKQDAVKFNADIARARTMTTTMEQ